jgi:hypothetical protein
LELVRYRGIALAGLSMEPGILLNVTHKAIIYAAYLVCYPYFSSLWSLYLGLLLTTGKMATIMDIEKTAVCESHEIAPIEHHPNLSSFSDEELLGKVSRLASSHAIADRRSRQQV